jgi:copper homeostasis protein
LITLEIVSYNIESALKAQEAGADRIELCADPGAGGATPSFGTVEVVRKNINIDLFVMIRPRGGDFLYSSFEFHAMKRDLIQFQKLSVDGIVTGILTKDGQVDKARCKELVERARPLKVTFHRAFDRTIDPFQALEDCIEVGFDRILTSGLKNTALEGVDLIAALKQRAGNRIVIMPGSGVNEQTAADIVRITGARELHLSAGTFRNSLMEQWNGNVTAMGSDAEHESHVRTVDPERIRKTRAAAEGALSLLP